MFVWGMYIQAMVMTFFALIKVSSETISASTCRYDLRFPAFSQSTSREIRCAKRVISGRVGGWAIHCGGLPAGGMSAKLQALCQGLPTLLAELEPF